MTGRQHDVLDVITRHPGATIQDVADELRLSHTCATYHLRALAKKRLVNRKRHGRTVRHFAVQHGRRQEHRLAPLMRDEKRSCVLSHLREADPSGTSINRLARRLGLNFGLMKSTLEELGDMGLVEVERVGGRYRIQATAALRHCLPSDDEVPDHMGRQPLTPALTPDEIVQAPWQIK